MWSSVMKTTLQLEHSKMCGPSSGNAARSVLRMVIVRPQFGQDGFCAMTDKRLRPGKVPGAARLTLPDIITYSSKATRHKEIYPYLRYGFVVRGSDALSKKFLTHNQGVDFAMSIADVPTDRKRLIDLVKRQIGNAEILVEMMRTNRTTFTRYEKNIDVER
jgi:hypothetical protein